MMSLAVFVSLFFFYSLLTGQPPGFTPAPFPKMGETGNFSVCANWKADGTPVLSRKCQGQNGKRQFSSECIRLIGSYRSVPCV